MFLPISDIQMHVQVDGPPGAPPLLLVHSLGTSLHVWDGQLPALSRSFRVIRLDLRGHGLSGVTPGPYRIEGMARDCLGVMDALGLGQAHIAGLSIGGMIAQSLAVQAPDRVASLILCDTAMTIPGREIYTERAAIVRAKGMEPIVDTV